MAVPGAAPSTPAATERTRGRGMRAATHLLHGLGGCGCGFTVFILALGLTGSYGFAASTLEGPPFVAAVIVGLGAPILAVIFLIRELIVAAIELFKQPPTVAVAASAPAVAVAAPAQTVVPDEPTGSPRLSSRPGLWTPWRGFIALAFVVLSTVYMWSVSDPAARGHLDWLTLVRDFVLGSAIGWFFQTRYDTRLGRAATLRDRLFAAVVLGGLLVSIDVFLVLEHGVSPGR